MAHLYLNLISVALLVMVLVVLKNHSIATQIWFFSYIEVSQKLSELVDSESELSHWIQLVKNFKIE